MNDKDFQVFEINGVKMGVDMRHAKIVHENLRVGSKIKILCKADYSGPKVYPGVVVGFEPFNELPTIIVAYIVHGYSEAKLEFAYVNSKTGDKFDLIPSIDDDLPIEKADIIKVFERDISKKEAEIAGIVAKRDFFLRHFNKYFVTEVA